MATGAMSFDGGRSGSSSRRKNKGVIKSTVRGAGVKAPQRTSTPVSGGPRGLRPTFSSTSSPTPVRQASSNTGGGSYSGGGSYNGGGGGGSYGGGSVAPMMAAPEPVMSETDWLGQDSVFQAAQAAYKNAFDLLASDITSRRDTYNVDYNNSLRDLGWNTQASPNDWNWEDTLTASGRAHNNQLNDFASRGMLQGSAYADALENLIRSLNQQRDTMGTARDTFLGGLERERAAGQKTRDDNIRQAEVAALERYRNQYTAI